MTEKERKQQLKEMQRRKDARMRMRTGVKEEPSGNLFLFRTYVAVILTGAVFTLSMFHTDTAQGLCKKVKDTIAYELPEEEVAKIKEQWIAIWNEGDITIPVFDEDPKIDKEEKSPTMYQPDIEADP